MSKATPNGGLGGTFLFKKDADGTLIKNKVLGKYCNDEFSYHQSTTSLKYHLRAYSRPLAMMQHQQQATDDRQR